MQKSVVASSLATAGVALGIGAAALAFGSGTALAAPDDSRSDSSSASASSSADPQKGSDADSPANKRGAAATEADKDDTDTGNDDSESDSESDADESDTTKTAKNDRDAKSYERSERDDESERDDAPTDDEAPSSESAEPSEDPKPTSDPDSGDDRSTAVNPTPAVAVDPVVVSAVPAAIEDRKAPAMPRTLAAAAPKLPDVPPRTPAEFFNWVCAQIQRTFFNRTPTTSPIQFVQTDSGEVVGSVRAVDADGDDLVYEMVTGPTRGTVVLHDDGSYSYTPNPSLVAEGGADSFRVAVSDVGLHLHLFNGTGTTNATVVVGVRADSEVDPADSSSEKFTIYNLSSSNVSYTRLLNGSVRSGPVVGTVFVPGSSASFELTRSFRNYNSATAWFDSEGQGAIFVEMAVPVGGGDAEVDCRAAYCSPDTGELVQAKTVVILDAPGTVIEIPAGEGQQQAQVLNQLCADRSLGSCNFIALRQEEEFSPAKQVSPSVRNATDERQTLSRQVSETEGYSDSLGGSVKFGGKLVEAINAEILVTYNHTWTTSKSYSDTVTITVPPWTEASIWAETPLNRVYGDLTVAMGNTVWILRDVYFDSPNPERQPVYSPRYVPIEHAASEAQETRAAPALAAPTGAGSVQDTISSLEDQGYRVIVNRLSAAAG